MRIIVALIFLCSCTTTADYVFDAQGNELDCKGRPAMQCIAAHCLHGYETIEWRDFGGGCTFRCKP